MPLLLPSQPLRNYYSLLISSLFLLPHIKALLCDVTGMHPIPPSFLYFCCIWHVNLLAGDSSNYNGHSTVAETLYMGLPCVTQPGDVVMCYWSLDAEMNCLRGINGQQSCCFTTSSRQQSERRGGAAPHTMLSCSTCHVALQVMPGEYEEVLAVVARGNANGRPNVSCRECIRFPWICK